MTPTIPQWVEKLDKWLMKFFWLDHDWDND